MVGQEISCVLYLSNEGLHVFWPWSKCYVHVLHKVTKPLMEARLVTILHAITEPTVVLLGRITKNRFASLLVRRWFEYLILHPTAMIRLSDLDQW